jgi:hypothetical protein
MYDSGENDPGGYGDADARAHSDGSDAGSPDAAGVGAGFGFPRFIDDIPGDAVGAAEIAALREIRAELIAEFGVIAAAEARRVRLLARAAEIAQARMARVSNRVQRGREMELRSIAAELGIATRVNDRTMQAHISDAEVLVRRFAATVEALEQGRISLAHASAIADTGNAIDDDEVRAAFEKVVLEHAGMNTPGRTRVFARRLAEQLNPRTIDDRFAVANEERRVWVTELADGMARLEALLPATEAFGIFDRLTRGAKAIADADRAERREHAEAEAALSTGDAGDAADSGAAGDDASRNESGTDAASNGDPDEPARFDDRTRDQVRADLFTDLLLTGSPAVDPTLDRRPGGIGAIRATVQITVPVTTLTGVTSGGGELDGRAPVDTETARRLARDAPGWDRVMTDPVTGTVLEVDRYEPLASQRRFLDTRDVHCRCPGCRQPARHCHRDHNDEYQHGGKTKLCNLCNLCVRHHTLKTETGWTVTQLAGGSLQWTSPLGYTYPDDPPPRVVFLPDPDEVPAPF